MPTLTDRYNQYSDQLHEMAVLLAKIKTAQHAALGLPPPNLLDVAGLIDTLKIEDTLLDKVCSILKLT
jgi:hypothetical protein